MRKKSLLFLASICILVIAVAVGGYNRKEKDKTEDKDIVTDITDEENKMDSTDDSIANQGVGWSESDDSSDKSTGNEQQNVSVTLEGDDENNTSNEVGNDTGTDATGDENDASDTTTEKDDSSDSKPEWIGPF